MRIVTRLLLLNKLAFNKIKRGREGRRVSNYYWISVIVSYFTSLIKVRIKTFKRVRL